MHHSLLLLTIAKPYERMRAYDAMCITNIRQALVTVARRRNLQGEKGLHIQLFHIGGINANVEAD